MIPSKNIQSLPMGRHTVQSTNNLIIVEVKNSYRVVCFKVQAILSQTLMGCSTLQRALPAETENSGAFYLMIKEALSYEICDNCTL